MGSMSERVERQASRMREVMDKLGVDGAKLARVRHGNAYAAARAECLLCRDTTKCLRWLDNADGEDVPEFCPSLALFEACKRSD